MKLDDDMQKIQNMKKAHECSCMNVHDMIEFHRKMNEIVML